MHIKSIVSDEDREELERMLSLGFIIPNQLFKTRQKSRMIIYIFTPVEFLLSINCYLSESYLMFGIGIGTCVQHINCLCRSAKGICCIGFGIGIIFHIEKCVSVNRYQLDCLRVVVDTCNDDGITVLCIQLLILASVVQSEQCIGGISRHLRCLIISYNILVCKICFLDVDLIQFG